MYNLHNKLKIPFVRVIKDRTGNSSRDKYILEDGLSPKNLFNEFGSGINTALTWSNSWVNFSLINTDSFIYMSLRDHTIKCDDSPSYKWYTLIGGVFDSKKRADEIGAIDGERKNSHLKKHKKRFNFRIPTNLVKSNSHKNSISQISSLGSLFEEVEKIKKLITY
jgi:hypothetical protein